MCIYIPVRALAAARSLAPPLSAHRYHRLPILFERLRYAAGSAKPFVSYTIRLAKGIISRATTSPFGTTEDRRPESGCSFDLLLLVMCDPRIPFTPVPP